MDVFVRGVYVLILELVCLVFGGVRFCRVAFARNSNRLCLV